MLNHLRIVAVLNIVLGAMHLMALGMVLLNLSRGNIEYAGLTRLLPIGLLLLSVPYIVTGIGLLYRKSWARKVAKFIDLVLLLEFPAGTPLGLYALWLFWFQDTDALFERRPKLTVLDKEDQGS